MRPRTGRPLASIASAPVVRAARQENPRFENRRFTGVLVASGIVAAVLLRLWILTSGLGAVDIDEAVSGLMARHVVHGHVSVFFWGQTYGGSQEAIATGVFFAIAGQSTLALKLVPMLACAGSAWLLWRLGRRTVGERAACVAAVLFLVGPGFFVLRSTRAYGFYGTGLFVCTAVLLAVVRLRERSSTIELAWLGLLVGLGWWATPQVVFVVVPALAWLAWSAPRLLRRAYIPALGALVGAAPWIVWTLTHGLASLRTDLDVPRNTYVTHLHRFFDPLLPMALGLRFPFTPDWVPGPVIGWVVYLGLLVGFGVLLWRRPPRLGLLLVVAGAYPFLFSISPASFYVGEPRYLFLLSPVIALLLAHLLVTRTSQIAGIAAVVGLSVATLAHVGGDNPANPRAPLRPLIAALESRGVNRVFSPYLVAHRLAFDSHERIIASPLTFVRSRDYDRMVRASPSPAYVMVDGTEEQVKLDQVLTARGIPAAQVKVGVFDIYLPVTKLLPEDWLG